MRYPILWNHDPRQTIGNCDVNGNIEFDTPIDLTQARLDGFIQVTEYETTNGIKQVKRAKLVGLSLIPDEVGAEIAKKSDVPAFDKMEILRKRRGLKLQFDDTVKDEDEKKEPISEPLKPVQYGFTKEDISKKKN